LSTRSEILTTRSEILSTRTENLCIRSENFFTQSENSFTQSENLSIRRRNSGTRTGKPGTKTKTPGVKPRALLSQNFSLIGIAYYFPFNVTNFGILLKLGEFSIIPPIKCIFHRFIAPASTQVLRYCFTTPEGWCSST
jgi:hypothetical protein